MLNSRSISPASWEHARQSLIFYFSRRHGISNAEDLAQQTLTAIWRRGDFEFEKEEDFLRVCYGFAGRISKAAVRQMRKHSGSELDPAAPEPTRRAYGLNPTEVGILVDEILKIAGTKLREKDRETIRIAAEGVDSAMDGSGANPRTAPDIGNNFRVRLFRARKKLAELTGWGKSQSNEQ
jgi:hypothetical protein